MRHYEVMVILDPSLDERTVAPSLDTFLNVIRTSGGNVEKVEVWGKRRLCFEINKNTEGIYAVLDLTSTPDAVKELDRQLGLQEIGAADEGPAARSAQGLKTGSSDRHGW